MNDNAQNTMTTEEIAELSAEMDSVMDQLEATDETNEESVDETVTEDTAESEEPEAETTETKKRGGKATLYSKKENIVAHLKIIDAADGEYHHKTGSVSRPLVMQLIDLGLVEAVEKPKTGKRGRPAVSYRLSRRGNILLGTALAAEESAQEAIEEIATSTDEEFQTAMEAETVNE